MEEVDVGKLILLDIEEVSQEVTSYIAMVQYIVPVEHKHQRFGGTEIMLQEKLQMMMEDIILHWQEVAEDIMEGMPVGTQTTRLVMYIIQAAQVAHLSFLVIQDVMQLARHQRHQI